MASEANAEEIKEEKGIKAKTISLIGKIIGGAIILIGFILKAFDIWNCEVKEICFIGATVGAIFGDISINTALDKFKKGGE